MKTPVKVGRKFIGWIQGNVFFKKVKKSKHLLRVIPAYGIDKEKFDNVIKPQVSLIVIIEMEGKVAYMTSTRKFKEKAIERDFGYGKQYFLPLTYWQTTKQGFVIEDEKVRTSKKEIVRALKGAE